MNNIAKDNKWLVAANPKYCRHSECLRQQGYISWKQESYPFEIGDIVFLYINGAVKFKTIVEATVNHREDSNYWIGEAPQQPTFRLKYIQESNGHGLQDKDLAQFGFKGGQSLRHYIHHNVSLLEYISNIFEQSSAF